MTFAAGDLLFFVPMADAWKVFYSYCHEDAACRNDLAQFLAPLRHAGRIEEWHDRQITPGVRWESEIFANLDAADLLVLLVSKSFLASDYCFGVEMERAMQRVKTGAAIAVPVLVGPCLWQESRFSELQCLPRNGKPVSTWASRDEALAEIAGEISRLVKAAAPPKDTPQSEDRAAGLSTVENQILAYARRYERVRQHMVAGDERTARMEEVFSAMCSLAVATFPLLPELVASPSPGEKLAAIAILRAFADVEYLPFLVEAVGSEKPFVSYHALRALAFAVSAVDPRFFPPLEAALNDAAMALQRAEAGLDPGREKVLRDAQSALAKEISSAGRYKATAVS